MKNLLFKPIVMLILLVLTSTTACQNMVKNQPLPSVGKINIEKNTQRGHLLKYEFITSIKREDINHLFPEKVELEGDISDIPKYDIDLYKIIYSSIYNNKPVELSGLVVVPKKKGEYAHLQYHHGTLMPYPMSDGYGWGSVDAPSLYKGQYPKVRREQYETRLNGNYLGSLGYLVSLPDYAGYGISSNLEHPYSVNPELAEESVDMILATKEFAKLKGLPVNNEVFLSGWSEGAAASVATQKLIESQYRDKLKVLANAPMAGFLNTRGNLQQAFLYMPSVDKDIGESMVFLAWTIYAYNKFSPEPIAFERIFNIPVTKDVDVLKNRPSSVPSQVFKPLDKYALQHMVKQSQRNNLIDDWVPIAPIFIHHGTKDEIVPYDNNAEVAAKSYQDKGAKAQLIKYDGYNHDSLALLQLKKMIKEFEQVQK